MLLYLLITAVFCQAGCESTNLPACKEANRIFKTFTCDPLYVKNATHYQHCLCYHNVNLALCYLQCNEPSSKAELDSQVQPQITAQCTAAGLNPRALPNPPIWQTYFGTASTSRSSPSPASNSVSSILGQPSTATKTSGAMLLEWSKTFIIFSMALLAGMII